MVKAGAIALLRSKTALANIALITNALVWYFVVMALFLQNILVKLFPTGGALYTVVWGVHFSSIIISALVGAWLGNRVNRGKLLTVWMLAGIFASMTLFMGGTTDILLVTVIGLLLGASLGFGMPACISQFTDSIPIDSRGRISGITFLASGIGIFAFSLAGINEFWLLLGVLLSIWRLAGFIILRLTKTFFGEKTKKTIISYKKIITQKSFILYFVPWVMFSLINYLVAPSSMNIGASSGNITLVQTGCMGLAAVIGGFFLDKVGRKRIAVVGFTLLGLGTAALGISTGALEIIYFNAIVDGIAWGLLLVLFILTIWGDLSQDSSSDKYYAIGVAPFFVSKFLDLAINTNNNINARLDTSQGALFSFGAFFLFIAVLPLVYAPETLPEKLMKDRDLRSYAEKALKQVQKESEKTPKKGNAKEENKQEKQEDPPKESPEDEEARKLAEKYY
jgi:MFS family permease